MSKPPSRGEMEAQLPGPRYSPQSTQGSGSGGLNEILHQLPVENDLNDPEYNARPSRFLPPGGGPIAQEPLEDEDLHDQYMLPDTEVANRIIFEQFAVEEIGLSRNSQLFLRKMEDVVISVDTVKNLPLNTACSRISLEFIAPYGRGFAFHPEIRAIQCVQNDHSYCLEPTFPQCRLQGSLTPKVLALITLDVIDRETGAPAVLGHLIVPLWSKKGSFEMRLSSGVFVNYVSPDSSSSSSAVPYLPLTSVVVRINTVSPQTMGAETIRMFDLNKSELAMLHERPSHEILAPADFHLSQHQAEDIFSAWDNQTRSSGGQDKMRADTSCYCNYNPSRGAVLIVHCMQNCIPLHQPAGRINPKQTTATTIKNPNAMWANIYKVTVELGGVVHFTTLHDWHADVRHPSYLNTKVHFPDLNYDPKITCMFRIFCMCLPPSELNKEFIPSEAQWQVLDYAWGVAGVFDPNEKYLHHTAGGQVQLFRGVPPSGLLADLESHPIERVLMEWAQKGKIMPVPANTFRLMVSLGDPLREDELIQEFASGVGSGHRVQLTLEEAMNPHGPLQRKVPASEINESANQFFVKALFK